MVGLDDVTLLKYLLDGEWTGILEFIPGDAVGRPSIQGCLYGTRGMAEPLRQRLKAWATVTQSS